MEDAIETTKLELGIYAVNPFLPNRPLIKIDLEQAWFWTKEWLEGELKVDEHIAKGEYETFNTIEEFLEGLK